ncbi:hypothetical protein FDG2_0546 [Candidatus Protofrankia californiensis]|uniref:Uncharacterized protein n=1 Tax=Candidatus Protofrankia californiensis TaxID=1839754 RepID=A0A1C3NTX0_9ACTN|nr:hypothetical protein FDG2_0546 [Candidatus Protofrankia californiensis]
MPLAAIVTGGNRRDVTQLIPLAHTTSSTNQRSAREGRQGRAVNQQRGDPLHPPLDREVVDDQAAFREQLFDIPVDSA